METDEERKAGDSSYHRAQVGPGDRGRKKNKKRNGFDLELIWIEIGVFKNKKFQRMSSLTL